MTKPTHGAVIAAIIAGNKTLLIRQPDRHNPRWKFPGGEIEAGEDVLVALAREIGDETQFPIKIHRGINNRWMLSDKSINVIHRSVRMWPNRDKNGEHAQHFFVIKAADERDILYLGNQRIREDDGETIETGIFDLDVVRTMQDFLQCQIPLLDQVLTHR